MKKRITFFAFAAALAFCYSCSNDETVATNDNAASNEISFRPLMNSVTRATSLNLASLVEDGFYVTATYTSDHTAYFANQLFKRRTADPECWAPYTGTAFTAIYWPSENADILDFHAYAPATGTQFVVSNNNVTTLNGCPEYSVTPDASAANQVDFLYASSLGKDYADASLPLTFAHKESQISINLKNTDANLKFTVSEVALCNIASTGIFKYRTTPSTGMAWGEQAAPISYTQGSLSLNYNGAVDASPAGVSWILIPQTLAKPTTDNQYASDAENAVYGGAYIRVKLKIQSTYNDYYFAGGSGDTESDWVYAIWPISTNASTMTWAEGSHYTYTIDLAGGGYFEKNQGSSTAALDRVITLHEITFATVTVSDWTPSNSTVGM